MNKVRVIGFFVGNDNLTKGGDVMKKGLMFLLGCCFMVLASCGSDGGKTDETCSDCQSFEQCVSGECKVPCQVTADCFQHFTSGRVCESGFCEIPGSNGIEGVEPDENGCVVSLEQCDGIDNDCDGQVDEGLKNVCGECGAVPSEVCDGKDNDCDGQTDEGVKNACGECGELPKEVCNGIDDDCDGSVPAVENDLDADGWMVCEGDCNDLTPAYHPKAEELCDGIDNDCDGLVPANEADSDVDGWRICDGDCLDTDKATNPGLPELCNLWDDDCDGDVDEGFFVGAPCLGTGACGAGFIECFNETMTVCSTVVGGSESQAIPEACSDNVDNDCDGSVDEGCDCDEGDLQICGSSDIGICTYGLQECGSEGTWGECVGSIEPFAEVCNGLDDDCDGSIPIDEADADGDGFRACLDCDEANAWVYPGAPETCNGVDDNCDGAIDEDYFVGVPCTGLGFCGSWLGVYECDGPKGFSCSTMPLMSADKSSPEACSDNFDNDCDGSVDEGCDCDLGDMKFCGTTDEGVCVIGLQTCLGDGTWDVCDGSIEPFPEVCNGLDDDCDGIVPASEADADNDGFMICEGDCADDTFMRSPAVKEICNGSDDDCDGDADEDFFIGVPCLGFGDCGAGVYECAGEDGSICSTMPGASADKSSPEICGDNVDNDCDGTVDDGCECDPGDQLVCGVSTVGECQSGIQVCLDNGTWSDCSGNVDPLPVELCNGLEDNCDGLIDIAEFDLDQDGFRGCENDCNEGDAQVNPAMGELCNGLDDNCDGAVDEGFFVGAPCVGLGACGAGQLECVADGLAAICSSAPGASADNSSPEICGDNVDSDCDGSVDEGCDCDPGDTKVCGASAVGECQMGMQSCDNAGKWGVCVGSIEPAPETCNGLDDDCDGAVLASEVDQDGDAEMICDGDCNDGDAEVNTGAKESCNAVDDDCDGAVDEGFFVGAPCLGPGACGVGQLECAADGLAAICSTAPGASKDKSVPEVCGDKVDNDCDGSVDNGCACDPGDIKFCGVTDLGVCEIGMQTCLPSGKWDACIGAIAPSPEACNGLDDDCDGAVGAGEVDADGDGVMICAGDCDDKTSAISPAAKDQCNGVDDDCDGAVDEGFFVGAPCAGTGSCKTGALECSGPEAVICSTMPGGSKDMSLPEACDDLVDNDCDGMVNDGCDCLVGAIKVCGSSAVSPCQKGLSTCGLDGKWGECVGNVEPAPEACDGVDNDCNGAVLASEVDADGDTFMVCGGDCNDGNAAVHPKAADGCNGVNDDCDGAIDEGFFVGAPCIGFGACALIGSLECMALDKVICSTMPGGSDDLSSPEVCGDFVDNDCDGSVDEVCKCVPGTKDVCGASDTLPCEKGLSTCGPDGQWGACVGAVDPVAEKCDGIDNDCDGALMLTEVDADKDGFMLCEGDCADKDGEVFPGAVELCNGFDDDCDGAVDEGYFLGAPCNGFGACGAGVYECAGELGYQCSTMPGGTKDASLPEVCGDNVDNDCDGSVEDGCECDPGDEKVCGSSDVSPCQKGTQQCGLNGKWGACAGNIEPKPEECNGIDDNCDGAVGAGEVDADDDGELFCEGDCNDSDAAVHTGANELCNSVDDDCDGAVDEGFFIGAPCTAAGACGDGKLECASVNSTRCSSGPGGSADKSKPEVCNDFVDNDCDKTVDEGCECTFNADPKKNPQLVCGTTDAGECAFGTESCQVNGKWGQCAGNIEPVAEKCNGLDDDCNGLVPANEADADKDGYRVCESDCDDTNNQVNPGEKEVCNNKDDDCDAQVDEGCATVSCNICCGFGLGHPVVWWGGNPVNSWSADGYCGVWTATVQQICVRGDYPVPGYTDAGWADWNCQNGNDWGGWEVDGVLWCVNGQGKAVKFEVVSGKVDPAAPDPEGEVILLDALCAQ